jgi:arylsulfatase A-like enzyme/Flp pilus assembly protein TadD
MKTAGRFALVALVACLSACQAQSRPAKPAPRRDVVIVTIDTLRYDAVGFDGNARGTTPNLDRAAAAGRVFAQTHAHNVLTLPSHTNILTGLYPYQHGVRDNAGFRLSSNVETVATILKAHGYATGAFVAAFPLDSRFGLTRGFDVYEEMYKQSEQPEDFEIQRARGEEVVARALEWYRGQAGRPRLLWTHVYDPHAPYDPPRPYRDRFGDDLYLGGVAYTDAALAPLLEAVRAVEPPPLLIVTADHGEARGDHGELTHGLFAYEATLHVPLVVWCPGLVAPGRDEVAAQHVDILPTVLDALGERPPSGLPGQTLLAAHRVESPGASYFESLSATLNRGWAPLRGLVSGGQKYIELPVPELYDLAADPDEKSNQVSQRLDVVRRLRKRLLDIPPGTVERGAVGAEEAAKLRSLGYLAGSTEIKKSYGPADDPKNLIDVDRQLHQVVDLFQQERGTEAIPIARRLVRERPDMKSAYLQLAFLLQWKGELGPALKVYEEADKRGLGGESLDRRRGLLLCETGRPREGVALLERYGQSEDVDTLNALGVALTDAGRADEGVAVFARALMLQPRNAQAFQSQGIALLKLGRLEEARRSLESALAISRRSPRALNALGVVWSRLGDPRKAVEAWSRCVEVDPQQYEALYNLGRVAGEIGDWKLAREALEKFVATAPPARYGKDIREVREVLAAMPAG